MNESTETVMKQPRREPKIPDKMKLTNFYFSLVNWPLSKSYIMREKAKTRISHLRMHTIPARIFIVMFHLSINQKAIAKLAITSA